MALICCAGVPGHAAELGFVDRTQEAGLGYLQHRYPDSGPGAVADFQTYFSGGAAAGDYDNDGHVDLYVTRMDATDILFRNLGDGTFADATAAAFGTPRNLKSNGCAWGDIDNDGDLDLYVTTLFSTGYLLYINDGDGGFREESYQRGAKVFSIDSHFGQSVAFGDYDLDGFLDFHVTEWRYAAQNPGGRPHNNRLLRNLGAAQPGHFTDVTVAAGVATDDLTPFLPEADSQGYAPRFSDIDHDGWPDLLLTSDHGTSRLFWNDGDGTFTDGTEAAGVGTDQFGMGSAVGDFDMDGDLDWFVSSIYEAFSPIARSGNRLYRNDGGRAFSDATDAAGVRDGGWGWGASFADFDHDGDLDLIQTNGADFPFYPENSAGFEDDPTRLWRNDGSGGFDEVAAAAGVVDTAAGKGLLTFDYDGDGDLDVFIVNNGGAPVLYENTGADGSDWLIIRPVGTRSNRQGLGARVSVVPESGDAPLVREVSGGSNFLGQDEVMAHFGLGEIAGDTVATVRIEWPGGAVQTLCEVPINQSHLVAEPDGAAAGGMQLRLSREPGGGLRLTWNAVVGGHYELEVGSDLADSGWSACRSICAEASEVSVVLAPDELTRYGDRAFFRVVEH